MKHLLRLLVPLLTAAAIGNSSPVRAQAPVDLLLVLSSDVSRSVDERKFQLQRDGYAAAITDPRVVNALGAGLNGQIAVSFVEWSGASSVKLVVDWSLIKDQHTSKIFADRLIEAPRSFADRTSISAGIDFAMAQLSRAPYQSRRRTIDVSGDGTNNSGRDVRIASDEAVAQGVTINGLVILTDQPTAWNPEHTNPPGGLPNYYRDNVIGGPGAFVMVAENHFSFGQALIRKLIAEIAAAPFGPQLR
jgi:hypothetical protein